MGAERVIASRIRIGAFPGSFDPPTLAHLAVAEAARDRFELERVDLVLSRIALEKPEVTSPTLDERCDVLAALASRLGWLGVTVSDAQLIVELTAGYDVVVMGADKWAQVTDPRFYGGDPARRDDAIAALPTIAVAPRPPWPATAALLLDVSPHHYETSSTLARSGRLDLMVAEAREFEQQHRRWTTRDT